LNFLVGDSIAIGVDVARGVEQSRTTCHRRVAIALRSQQAARSCCPDLYADDNPSDDPTHDTSPPPGTSTKSRLSVLGLTAATGAAMAAGTFAFSNVKELPQRVWDLPSKAASYMPQQLFA